MQITHDLFFLDRVPGVGESVGLAGAGADVAIDPREQTAFDYSGADRFVVASATTSVINFEMNAQTYETTAIERVGFSHATGSGTGYVITISPTAGGPPQYLFLPDDSAGDINLSSFAITSSQPLVFTDQNHALTDQNHSFVTCFAADTLILTPDGPRPAAQIGPGDLVTTADHGPQPCLVRLDRTVRATTWLAKADAPVFLPAGAIQAGQPARPLYVSRQHRVMLRGPLVLAETGHAEVLVAAKDLCGWNGITLCRFHRTMRYVHLVLASHEIILAEGLATESFFAGGKIPVDLREALQGHASAVLPARPFVTGRRARALVRRLRAAGTGARLPVAHAARAL